MVLRPDSQSALTALQAVALLEEAGLPERVLQVVLGAARHRRGRPGRGRLRLLHRLHRDRSLVAQRAAERLVGASLELGGKNAMYVAADADLPRAVQGAVRACFSSAGQLCISVERLLVHEDVAEEFLAAFVRATRAMRLGATLGYGADMGIPAPRPSWSGSTRHVEDARAKGAQVLTGGRHRPDIGPYFYEPTVLADVTAAMGCRDEETFGPVVSVYRVAVRRGGRHPGQRQRLRPQRLDLDPGRRSRPAAGRNGAGRHGQRQRRLRRGLGQHRRADGRHEGLRPLAGGTAPRASRSTPRPRPSRPSAWSASPAAPGQPTSSGPRAHDRCR